MEEIKKLIEQRESLLKELSLGKTTEDKLNTLQKITRKLYKQKEKPLGEFIRLQAYSDFAIRIKEMLFTPASPSLSPQARNKLISQHFKTAITVCTPIQQLLEELPHRTALTKPEFYGLRPSEYTLSVNRLIHISMRHLLHFRALGTQTDPITLRNLTFPIQLLFMAIELIEASEWQYTHNGRNRFCHFELEGTIYTIVRRGLTQRINSFYPRNQAFKANAILLGWSEAGPFLIRR